MWPILSVEVCYCAMCIYISNTILMYLSDRGSVSHAVLNIVVSLISLEKGTERQRESKRKTKSDGEK